VVAGQIEVNKRMKSRRPKPGQRFIQPQVLPDLVGDPWSYGIIAVAERTTTLLLQTMESLASAGFDSPIIFVDGGVPCGFQHNQIVSHKTKIGHPNNWITALFHLYATHPQANRYALFEDDLLACKDLKLYLESCPFPEKGYWNLLTHEENVKLTNRVKGWHLANQRGKGAVGLVFDQEGVETILFRRDFTMGGKGVDGMIISCMKSHGFKEYIHYPSLLQHQGAISTLGHRFGKVKSFPGVDYSPMEDP